jgi:hypothetical protein
VPLSSILRSVWQVRVGDRPRFASTTKHGGGDRAAVMIFFEKLLAPTLGLSRGGTKRATFARGGARAVTQLLLSACQGIAQ